MAEPEQPSTARMIDFWLDGEHHFPVDVAAARAFEEAYGPCAAIFRDLRDFLGRAVGVVFLGLAAFLDDETLARTLDELYEAVAPGSFLAFDFDSEELAGYPQALAMMGPQFRMRTPASFAPLLGRWVPTAEGIVPVARWRPRGEPAAVPDAFHGGLAGKPTD
ncbi:SAM-dependent methyltransferase [Micromonospora purpureochromogenes]|uniref:SAM-dependent methyltransferase n=1 Tax=Micromonospora purpureochromogenes TaxID=47872 RepID=UPI0033FA1914